MKLTPFKPARIPGYVTGYNIAEKKIDLELRRKFYTTFNKTTRIVEVELAIRRKTKNHYDFV